MHKIRRKLMLFFVLLAALAMLGLTALAEGAGSGSAVISFPGLPQADQGEGVTAMSLYRVGQMKADAANGGDSVTDFTVLPAYDGADGLKALLSKTGELQAADTAAAVASLESLVQGADIYGSEVWVSGGTAVFTGLESGVYLGVVTTSPDELSVTPVLFFLRESGGVQPNAKWELVTKAEVQKAWADDENRDGARPGEIYVALYQQSTGDGIPYVDKDGSYVVKKLTAPGWSAATDFVLPKYTDESHNATYTYLWHEIKITGTDSQSNRVTGFERLDTKDTEQALIRAGYTASEAAPSFDETENTWKSTITNSRPTQTVKLTVKKVWDDNKNQDGVQPPELVVTLTETSRKEGVQTVSGYEEVVLSEDNDWTFTTEELPAYKTGAVGDRISYEWSEPEIADYSLTKTDISADGLTTTLTNTHNPGKTSASVRKVWTDSEDQDGIRPTSVTVVLQKKNGGDRGSEDGWADCTSPAVTQTLSASNNWRYTQTNLDAYTGGTINYYRWREETIPQVSGHTAYGDPVVVVTGTTTVISNPHTPETVEETVVKAWTGEGGNTQYRPSEVTVQLSGGTYSKRFTLNAANNWTTTVTGLQKYEGGKEINYVWTEVQTNTTRYRTTTPARNAATRTTTITNTYIPRTSISVTKSWSDNNDEDGSRPDSVTVRLLANGSAYGADVTLTASSQTAWSYTWTDLPTTDLDGAAITYTVSEVSVPTGYTARVTGSAAAGFVIVNTHTPARGALRITKSVTVNGSATTGTAADGTYVFTVTGPHDYSGTVRITVRNGASSTTRVTNLPVGTYTISEAVPSNMTLTGGNNRTVEVTAGNTANVPEVTFVNNLTPETNPPTETNPPETNPPQTNPPTETNPQTEPQGETTTISGQKIWEDDNNVHGLRPASITVRLYANGTASDAQPTWTSTSGNTWSYTFGELAARDSAGRAIRYTVQEDPVEGYTTRISGLTITNTLEERTPKNYTSLSGTKSWADNANADGSRPNMITVRLLRDGVEQENRTVTAATGWSYTFQNLPQDDGYGHTYKYAIREDGVNGYYSRISGYDLTNSLIPRRPTYTNGNTPPGTPTYIVPGSPVSDNPVLIRRSTEIPPFGELTEENLEELLDLFDYGTPLFGMLLGTGDVMPIYPFIFGGIGTVAVLLLIVTGRRRKKEESAE